MKFGCHSIQSNLDDPELNYPDFPKCGQLRQIFELPLRSLMICSVYKTYTRFNSFDCPDFRSGETMESSFRCLDNQVLTVPL